MRGTKVLLAGYYGCGNLGDDALFYGLAQSLLEEGFDISVLMGGSDHTAQMLEIPSIPRKEWGRVNRAISNCDVLVFGGGSIFQDVTSLGSILYYASLILTARLHGKKIVLLGQGLGPLKTPLGKFITTQALKRVHGITVRDKDSLELLKQLGIKTPCEQTADLAFLLTPLSHISQKPSPQIGLAPRPTPHVNEENLIHFWKQLANELVKDGYEPIWLAMHPEHDQPLINKITRELPKTINSPENLLKHISSLDGMIAMRLHAGIFCVLCDKPTYMISYDPKVTSFAQETGLPFSIMNNQINGEQVWIDFRNNSLNLAHPNLRSQQMIAKSRVNLTFLKKILSKL